MPDEMRFEEEMEDFDKGFELREALKMPGALASLITVAILGPLLGLISETMGGLIEQVFSLPLIFVFLIEVFLNKNIDIRKNVGLLLIMSYGIYLIKNLDVLLDKFIQLHWLFAVSLVIAFTAILIYYAFHKLLPVIEDIIPKKQKISKRFSFMFAFIPAVVLSLVFLFSFKQLGLYDIEAITQLIKTLAAGG